MASSNGIRPTTTLARQSGSDSGPLLLCFSHLRWNFVYQRPQHLLTRASRRHRVVFFEEPIVDPALRSADQSRLDVSSVEPGITVAVPRIPDGLAAGSETRVKRAMVNQLIATRRRDGDLVLWYYTPMALGFSDHLMADLVVYDCMDELSAFANAPPRLVGYERALFDRADVVFTGGQSLYEAKQRQHRNVHLFPSSIDQAHFGRARGARVCDPADQGAIPCPRIGFFGVIDERMDLGLVAALADQRPDWQFVMLGPVVKIDPATLPRRANIHWLGSKSYTQLPEYLAHWDAGFMPFARNAATRFISPTKTPEFLAAGVPVVSTPIRDVVRPYGDEGLVGIAGEPAAFEGALAEALRRPRTDWLAAVDGRLAGMSWDRTYLRMSARMEEAKAAARAGAAVVATGRSRAIAGQEVAGV